MSLVRILPYLLDMQYSYISMGAEGRSFTSDCFKKLQLIPGHCLFEEFGSLFPVALCCSNGLSVFSFSISQSRYMLPAKDEVKISNNRCVVTSI